MTDEDNVEEGAEEAIEDLEAPAAAAGDVTGGLCPAGTDACHLPTTGCSNPTCTVQTFCKPGTVQGCTKPTCGLTVVLVQ
ncbi:MAG TPA: hypothetical protein VGG08_04530 [Solirubrobacteraceae bacterium]